jgi:hypothetical protein
VAHLSESIRSTVQYFAYRVGTGTLESNGLLRGVDYRAALSRDFGQLQLVFAVFTNVLEVDDHGRVTNAPAATVRAAQVLRRLAQPSYVVDPPLADWEIAQPG